MKRKITTKTTFQALIILALCLFIFLFSVKTTLLFAPFTPQQQNALGYLNDKAELNGNYTAAERSHMQDVKNIFRGGNAMFLILLILMIFLFSLFYVSQKRIEKEWSGKEEIWKILRGFGIVMVGFVVVILLSLLLAFNTSFTIFHKIFFPQGNWQFPEGSILIQVFPLEFFMKMSFFIFFQALIWGMIFILVSLSLKKLSLTKKCK